jgi:hypothetical protein
MGADPEQMLAYMPESHSRARSAALKSIAIDLSINTIDLSISSEKVGSKIGAGNCGLQTSNYGL